ncbi:MAG: hypothetical protein R8L53_01370 [Mariprofundales bacterium]
MKKMEITDSKIAKLFDKYSYSIVNPCETKYQKNIAIGIAKTLWLLLVKGEDTENNIYKVLISFMHDHDATMSLGSLYFNGMKSALTIEEIQSLKSYYECPENFNALKYWGDLSSVN